MKKIINTIGSSVKDLLELISFYEITDESFEIYANGPDLLDMSKRIANALGRVPKEFSTAAINDYKEKVILSRRHLNTNQIFLARLLAVHINTILECAIDNCIIAILKNGNVNWGNLDKVKISIAQFKSSDCEEEMLLEIKRSLKSPIGLAAPGYNELLNRVGIKYDQCENIDRVISDLIATRNIIVHANGVIDKKYILKCPYNIKAVIGGDLFISKNTLHLYIVASACFLLKIKIANDYWDESEDRKDIISFVKETEEKIWDKLLAIYGIDNIKPSGINCPTSGCTGVADAAR